MVVTVQTRPAQQGVILPHGESAGRQVTLSSCASSSENRSTSGSTDGSSPVALHPPFVSIFANVVRSVACAASTQAGSGSLPVWIARRKHVFSADDALSAACILANPHATAGASGAALAPAARTMVSATALTDRVIEVCIFVSSCVAWWSAGGGRRRNARQHSYARRDRPDAARRDDGASGDGFSVFPQTGADCSTGGECPLRS